MKRPTTIVLDSWAIMAYLQDEPAAERIADMIADTREQGGRMLMSVVNVGEVWYSFARRRSTADADQALRWINEIGIELVDADIELTRIAARYKAKGGISYADCFAAAVAKHYKAALLTGDQEFKRVEDEITIAWL